MRCILCVPAVLAMATPLFAQVGLYPSVISDTNISGLDMSRFIGPPDDNFYGLGGDYLTFDFGGPIIIDGPGPDLNIYEVDWGSPEFHLADIMVSADGVTFFNLDSTMGPAVDLLDDDTHSNAEFRKSFDLGPSGLLAVRFVKIQGTDGGHAGGTSGFDLDAIGAVNYVPEPGALAMAGVGLLVTLTWRRR